MKIRVDEEGAKALKSLLHLALRDGGYDNLDAVNAIRAGITVDEKPVIEHAVEDGDSVERRGPRSEPFIDSDRDPGPTGSVSANDPRATR